MPFFSAPKALRLRSFPAPSSHFVAMASQSHDYSASALYGALGNAHSSHPDFANLALLVFEAVMEVVCVSAPGYVVARMGQFDAESQKFLANLNTQLFTPCLSEWPPPPRWPLQLVLTMCLCSLHQTGLSIDCREAV